MADSKVSPLASPAQFSPANNLDNDKPCLYLAVIQQPIHRWQRPWQHQRAVALFVASPLEMKLRLQLEGRLKTGEHLLEVIQVGQLRKPVASVSLSMFLNPDGQEVRFAD